MLLPRLELIDLLHRVQVHGVDSQPIKGVRRYRDEIALPQAGHDVVNPVCLGLIGMDTQNLRGQKTYPVNECVVNSETITSTLCGASDASAARCPSGQTS